jgi:lysophospholipase L1-like esterase
MSGGTFGSSSGGQSSGGEASGGQSSGGEASGGQSSGGQDGSGGESASGGQGSSSGGAMNAPFEPCPASGACKILPLGDSITVGWGSTNYGSYRVELFRRARTAGHEITFTGTKADGPNTVDGVTFPRKHEGIAGETISQIQGRVDAALRAETPHIVIVHAGTNDMSRMPDGAATRLEGLVDKLTNDLPDALIVVSTIVPFPQYASQVTAFNATVQPMIEERADAGKHVIFVDQFQGFPNNELGDGVHPNDAGYTRMAGKWFSAIEDYL